MTKIKKISKSLILLVLVIGCSVVNSSNSKEDEVVMSIKNNTLSNQGVVVVITGTDKLESSLMFSSDFKISKLTNKNYVPLDYIIANVGWDDIGYPIKRDTSIEIEIQWEYLYGKLEPGSYKLEKEYFVEDQVDIKKTVATEFEIR